MKKSFQIQRRRLLTSLGIGAGGAMLAQALSPFVTHANGNEPPPLFITAYFQGGWDSLLFLDPRDNVDFSVDHRASGATPPPVEMRQIETNYHENRGATANGRAGGAPLKDPEKFPGYGAKQPWEMPEFSGLIRPAGSNIVFGPSIGNMQDHFDKLCIIRGIRMNTASHFSGMRYFLTGRFPKRSVAEGNSLSSYVSGSSLANSGNLPVPNLSLGPLETYNVDFPPRASALQTFGTKQLRAMLAPVMPDYCVASQQNCQSERPSEAMLKAIAAYRKTSPCLHRQLNHVDGSLAPVSSYRDAYGQSHALLTGELWKNFANLPSSAPSENVAIAAKALSSGLSHCVSLWLSKNLDTHFGDAWASRAGSDLRSGLDSLAWLIDYLANTPDPLVPGKMLWARTRLLAFSEFARTAKFNSSGGRDHHLGNACIVAGGGIRGNHVVGQTRDKDYKGMPVAFAKGDRQIFPQDVHRTLCAAMKLPPDPQLDRNEVMPEIIPGVLA